MIKMDNSYDERIEELLEGPYWIADILPEQVPAETGGQYPAVDRYFRQPERLAAIHRRQAEILLRLNCYQEMVASFDGGESWERNPEPEGFAARLSALPSQADFRALFPGRKAMIGIDPEDTWMTVWCPEPDFRQMIRQLALGEGFFFWQP